MFLSFKNKSLIFFGGVVFLFFILMQSASAADITSAQSGNWSDTNTWVGGAVPGDGDVAYIADTHTVVVDTNTTIGPSGTSTELAVFLNSTGRSSGVISTP